MSSLFLFGAGASFGSGPCTPHSPPLGAALFNALQEKGGVAAQVSQELADMFKSDFEKGMDRFWSEHNPAVTPLLLDMARYFAPFEPLPGNAYLELVKVLKKGMKKAVMVTTNYDLLIERAICMSGLYVSYCGFPVEKHNIPVLKIHGSCNFLPDIPHNQFQGCSFDLSSAPNASIIEANVRVANSTNEILDFCNREDSVAPALAVYSPTKNVLFCKGFVQEQQKAWREALHAASRVYVIGLRVHLIDTHIWGELAKTKSKIFYIGREPQDFLSWAHQVKHRSCYVLDDSFDTAISKIATHHGYRAK